MTDCAISIIAPYPLTDYITETNLEVEESPAPWDPDLSYVKYSECTYAGAIWRFLGNENTPVGKIPSDTRVGSAYWAPLHTTIKDRAYVSNYNPYKSYQAGEMTMVVVSGVYYRYRSRESGNKGNPVPGNNSSTIHWEFVDNSRERYVYLPVYENKAWKVGSVVWDGGTYYTGRAWIAISDVPQNLAEPQKVKPPTLNTKDEPDGQVFWEFVRLTTPLKILDVSPYTQAVRADEISLKLEVNKPISDVIFLNMLGHQIEVKITDSSGANVIFDKTEDIRGRITRLWHFREPRKPVTDYHVKDLPYYLGTKHEIKISGSTAKLGAVIIGQRFELGETTINVGSSGASTNSLQKDNFALLGLREGVGITDFDYVIRVPKGRYNEVSEFLKLVKGNIVYFDVPGAVETLGGAAILKDYSFPYTSTGYHLLTIRAGGLENYGQTS